MNPLRRLSEEHGQSPWLDNLKRGYLTSGQLAALRDRGIRGLTSNPTIFQKAIQGSSDYDEQFKELALDEHPIVDDYWQLVIADIHGACDVFSRTYDLTDGLDGYASVEVAPELANDSAGTAAAARGLHEQIKRRNLMVKIPATAAGVEPIRQMIAEGRNINVTLIFSLERHQEVMDAYLAGLEEYATTPGADLTRVASVASFFISRVDTEVDRRLEAIGTDPRRWRCAARRRSPRASSPTSSSVPRSRVPVGTRWPPAGLACSDRCGRARRPRTRPTPTPSTSTS